MKDNATMSVINYVVNRDVILERVEDNSLNGVGDEYITWCIMGNVARNINTGALSEYTVRCNFHTNVLLQTALNPIARSIKLSTKDFTSAKTNDLT